MVEGSAACGTTAGECGGTRDRTAGEEFLQTKGENIHWSFIQAVLTSVAEIAIIPLQDVLGLGSEARMNMPGRAKGNWDWRFEEKQIHRDVVERLRDLTAVSGR